MEQIKDGSEPIERRATPFQPPRGMTPVHNPETFSPPFRKVLSDEDERGGTHLRHFIGVVGKHKWKLVTFVAAGMLASAVVTLLLHPLYKSGVKINVERRGNSGFVGQEAGMQASGFDMDQVMITQVEVIKSDPVLRPAAEKYHLLDVEKQFTGLTPDEAGRLRKAPIVLKRLKVLRIPNSYLIELSYEAPDPKLAADVANTISSSYVEHAFDSRDRSYLQATHAIERQLKDLQDKMDASGKALAAFNQQMGIIDPEQRVSILSARLLQLDTDFTAAQSDRVKKEAVLDSTRSGDLAAAQVSTHAEPLQQIIERVGAARQEFAVARTTYAENHPEYKKAKNKLAELETEFQEMRSNTLQRVQEDYNQALGRELKSYKLVGETKSEVDHLNGAAFEYAQLKSASDNYKKLYQDLDRVTREEDINRNFQDSVIQVEESARPAAKQAFPSMPIDLAVAFLLCSLIGVAAAIVFDMLNTKLSNADDVSFKLPHVDVIASLPKTKKSLQLGGPSRESYVVGKMAKSKRTHMLMQYHESIRVLRNNIDFATADLTLRSLLLTSASPGEGKSTIAANLAFSYALLGRKVLLIDADMRRPSLHKLFAKTVVHGLAELLEEKGDWDGALLKIAREHLFLLPAGQMSERSPDLVGSALQKVLDRAYQDFDFVVLDGPPLLGAPEATQLASQASGVLVVTRANFSSVKKVEQAYALLRRSRANVIGMVMDDVADCGRVDSTYQVPRAVSEPV